MKNGLKLLKFMYFFSCFFVILGNTSFAYIDTSAVTYVIQAVAGVAIAVGAACTVYRHKIAKWFRAQQKKRAKKKHQAAENKDDQKDEQ